MTGNQGTEQPARQETFKEQLDRAADEQLEAKTSSHQPNPIVEKITEYVPAAAKVLGTPKQHEPEPSKTEVDGPPNRPDHDPKIEEFVRDQHRSKHEDGTLDV